MIKESIQNIKNCEKKMKTSWTYYDTVLSQGLSPSSIISVSGDRARRSFPGVPRAVTVLSASPNQYK